MAQKPPDLDADGNPVSVKPPDLDSNHTPISEAKQPTDVALTISKGADEPVEDRKTTPEEDQQIESGLSKIWKQQTTPLVNLSPQTEEALAGFNTEHPVLGGIANTALRTVLGMSSPLNLETLGVGGIEVGAAKAGLPALAKIASVGTRLMSAPVAAEGASNLFGSDKSTSERIGGGLELAGGIFGMSHRVPEIADSMKSNAKQSIDETFLHGTSSKNADLIKSSNRFTPGDRQYDYSVAGPDATYFGRPNDFWFDKKAVEGARGISYDSQIKAKLAPNAKIAILNSPADLERLAKKAGFRDVKDLETQLFVDGLHDKASSYELGDNDPGYKSNIAAQQRSREAAQRFATLNGIDGIDDRYGSDIFGGKQLIMFNNSKIRPIFNSKPPDLDANHKPVQEPYSYYTPRTEGMSNEDLRLARKETAITKFPEEVNNVLDPLAKKWVADKSNRYDVGNQMVEIRKFMEAGHTPEQVFKDSPNVDPNLNNDIGNPKNAGTGNHPALRPAIKVDPRTQALLDKRPDKDTIGEVIDKRRSAIQEAMMLPKGIMASYDLSAPGRQGLPLIANKEWWTSWGSMVKSLGSEDAFRNIQQSIAEKPLFKDYGQGSFATKVGLHLSDLTNLNNREEAIMSSVAEKLPGVRASNRAYTAYLNKLRADTFERMISNAKVLGTDGEFNMPAARTIASFVNTATGRGSLGPLEKYATELNTIFFSPRMIASRLQILNPKYYWAAPEGVRRQAIRSLFAIAGTGALIGKVIKETGSGTVEPNPTSSDFGKIKVGNTRIDPFGGFQQYVTFASKFLENQEKSTVTEKTHEFGKGYKAKDRYDLTRNFTESKLNPALSLAIELMKGKDIAGKPLDIPEAIAQRFIPLFLQDLKTVATENPNLIPGYSDLGLENADPKRAMLAIPGAFGAGVQNYPSKR